MKTITVHQVVTRETFINDNDRHVLVDHGYLRTSKVAVENKFIPESMGIDYEQELLEVIPLIKFVNHNPENPLSTPKIYKEEYVAFDSSYKDVVGDVNEVIDGLRHDADVWRNNKFKVDGELVRCKKVNNNFEDENNKLKRRIKYFTDLSLFERIKYAIRNKI